MARARAGTRPAAPKRLPRGRHGLAPEEVLRDQRERLVDAVPHMVAQRGYEAMSVADIVKAAVSRNAFYKNFAGEQVCFAVAHGAGHERLFEVLTRFVRGGRDDRGARRALAPRRPRRDGPRLRHGPHALRRGALAGEEIALGYHE